MCTVSKLRVQRFVVYVGTTDPAKEDLDSTRAEAIFLYGTSVSLGHCFIN